MVGNNGGLFVWSESEGSTTTVNSAFSSDGTTWSTPTPVIFHIPSVLPPMPSLGVFKNHYYLTIVDTDQALWLSSSPDGVAWSTPTNPYGSWQTVTTPGLAAFAKQFYLAMIGTDDNLYLVSSSDGVTWSSIAESAKPFGSQQVCRSPNLIAFNNQLYVAAVDLDTLSVCLTSSPDGVTWSQQLTYPFGSWQISQNDSGPVMSLAVFNHQLFMVLLGSGDPGGVVALASSTDGGTWSGSTTLFGSTTQYFQPALAVFNNTLFMGLGLVESEQGTALASSANGATWTGPTPVLSSAPIPGGFCLAGVFMPQAIQGWFYIQSVLTDAVNTPYVLNVAGAQTQPGTSVILYPVQSTVPNELWQFTSNGNIVSALNPQLALGSGGTSTNGYNVVIQQLDTSLSSLQWLLTSGGTIVNQYNGSVLSADGSASRDTSISLSTPESGSSPYTTWSIVPVTWVPQWVFIHSALTDADNTPYVLNVAGASSNPGTWVILYQQQQNAPQDLWQFTKDGHILSALSPHLVLSLGSETDGGYQVVVDTPQASTPVNPPTSQLWNTQGASNQILNQSSTYGLVVQGGTNGPVAPSNDLSILSAPGESEDNPSYQWFTVPGFPFDAILAQPPQPFPDFQGDQWTVYTFVNQHLGVTDLRQQYANLALDLSTYPLQMYYLPRRHGIAQSDWNAVLLQLTTEIGMVLNTRSLFAQYMQYHTALFADEGARLNQLGTDADMTQGDNTSVNVLLLSIFEGVLYTVLEAIPGEEGVAVNPFAVLGNVMEAGINIAVSASSMSNAISPDPFQVAYSELWNQLSTAFESLLQTLGTMETTLLTDWGKLQAVDALIKATGPNSLAWPATLTGDLIASSIPGYEIAVMQMLLPAKYQIYVTGGNDPSPLSGVPWYAQWVVQLEGENNYGKYMIAEAGNPSVYPSQEALQNDVWDNGVSWSDFFTGMNGWGFAVAYDNALFANWSVRPYVIVTLTNCTPHILTVAVPTSVGPSSQTLTPYGSVAFPLASAPDTQDFTITDPSYGAVNPVATFGVTVGLTPPVYVTSQTTVMGYGLTQPLCNPKTSFYTAAVQIGVCVASIA